MLSSYLNQGAVLRRAAGTDDRGQPVHGPVQAIRCRRQKRTRLVMAAQGATRVKEIVYYTVKPVAEGDMLDDAIVTGVDSWVGLNGEVLGFKAVV